MSLGSGPGVGLIAASEPLAEPTAQPVTFEQAMQTAREKRDDLRMRRWAVEREEVQVSYSRNQALPRLDVVAGYGLNGLGATEARALRWQSDFPSWNVGVQLSMPIGANRQAEADITAARVRRADAQVQLGALEAAVASDIDTGIATVQSTAERWRLLSEVAQREQAQLEQERKRQAAGRSDMREILMREERAINARLAVAEQQVAWMKAQVLLDAAQGVLLERYK
jgi:outer membrane protein TolC